MYVSSVLLQFWITSYDLSESHERNNTIVPLYAYFNGIMILFRNSIRSTWDRLRHCIVSIQGSFKGFHKQLLWLYQVNTLDSHTAFLSLNKKQCLYASLFLMKMKKSKIYKIHKVARNTLTITGSLSLIINGSKNNDKYYVLKANAHSNTRSNNAHKSNF